MPTLTPPMVSPGVTVATHRLASVRQMRKNAMRRFSRGQFLALVVVAIVGVFSIFFCLESAKTLGSHEGYALIPAREMLQSGDFVVPTFGEVPRLKKPPLIYWMISGVAALSGSLDIFVARLPAGISAILLGGLVAYWGWRWYGPFAAIGGLAAQMTSVWVLSFGRKAEVDMTLVLLIAFALFLVVSQQAEESRGRRFWRWAGIWLCVSLSWLGKFHFAPAMIFGPAVAWLLLERRFAVLWGLFNPLGLFLCACSVLAWPGLVLSQLPEAWGIWQDETLGRALGTLGRQPVWYYVPHVLAWTLPWAPFPLLALPLSWREAFPWPRRDMFLSVGSRRTGWGARLREAGRFVGFSLSQGDPRERFLWVWFGVSLAVVSISANKHPHYILPALPAFSLWTGRRFEQLAALRKQGKPIVSGLLAVLVTLSVAGGVMLLAMFPEPFEELPEVALWAVVLVGAGTLVMVTWLTYARRAAPALALSAAGWIVAYGIAVSILVPAQDHRRAAYQFGVDARDLAGPSAAVGAHGIDKDAILWYSGDPAFRTESGRDVARRLERTPDLWLLTISSEIDILQHVGNVTVVRRFEDRPGFPRVTLGHYRQMVLLRVEVFPPSAQPRSCDDGGLSRSLTGL